MNLLVTAGNTQTPIDRVRCITNIFTGRTGAQVALEAHRRGHAVTLLTSHPEVIRDLAPAFKPDSRWAVRPYRTFHELHDAMAELVPGNRCETEVSPMVELAPGHKVKCHLPAEVFAAMQPVIRLAETASR